MGGRGGTKRVAAALAVLKAGAAADGFVEVTGALDTGEVFLQGWAADLPEDQARVLVSRGGRPPSGLPGGERAPRRLGDAGRGFAGLLDTGARPRTRPPSSGCLPRPERLARPRECTTAAWRSAPPTYRPTSATCSPAPRPPPRPLRRLRRAADRFDGRDTVSLTRKPVRLGIDMAVEMPAAGCSSAAGSSTPAPT
jgi:hypothetical protein